MKNNILTSLWITFLLSIVEIALILDNILIFKPHLYKLIFNVIVALMVYKFIFLVLFLSAVNNSEAQESMMTEVSYPYLQKLIATAKANYPKMKVYDHTIKIAQMNITRAKLDWLNALSFIYIINPGGSGSTGALGGFQTGVSVSIGTILQKPGLIKASREELSIANLGKDEYNLSIEAMVQQKYFTYVEQLTLLNWRNKDLQNLESTLKDLKYKFEKGEEAFENYNKALTAYSSGVQSRIQAEGAFLIAKSSLEEIIGVKLETIK